MPDEEFVAKDRSFVTVAEAARALGVDARQVRRWADRLPDSDKGSDTSRKYRGVPIATVRLSALQALQSEGLSPVTATGEPAKDSDIETGQQFGNDERPVRPSDRPNRRVSQNQDSLREIIERQDKEIERLSAALSASQQIASQAQQLQLLAERRLAEVEGKALPAHEPVGGTSPGGGQESSSGTPRADSSPSSGSGGTIPSPGVSEEPRRGFLSFLRRWW